MLIERNSSLVIFILIVILICILIYTIIVGNQKEKQLKLLNEQRQALHKFSVDIEFNPFPRKINVSNKYDCNAENLRLCDINDSSTLFGCKELIVRCHHFDKDIEYVRNNISTTIPANKTPNEGYALSITVISEACNAYHGDLTLVALDTETNEYMLLCICKNPGYIGNTNILGNCSTPFICNGRIDDINKPLNKIHCKCSEIEKATRYDDGLPVCKEMTVNDANNALEDWTHLVPWSSNRVLQIANFNPTITDNLHVKYLLDPCRNSLDRPTFEIRNGKFDAIANTCHFTDFGFPVSNGMLRFKPIDSDNTENLISNDGALSTSKYMFIRFSDNIAGKRRIYGLGLTNLKQAIATGGTTSVVVVPPNGLLMGDQRQINISTARQMIAPKCSVFWPFYHCRMTENFGHKEHGLSVGGYEECPQSLLWKKEEWNDANETFRYGVPFKLYSPSLDNRHFLKWPSTRNYGIVWVSSTSSRYPYQKSGIVQFESPESYNIHKSVVT